MLTRQSFAAAVAAIARILSIAGRAVTLLRRTRSQTVPRRGDTLPRLGEPPRIALSHATTTPAQHALAEAHALRGEYRAIRLSEIAPASTPSRLVYDDIDRLAESIAGGAEHQGLGLLVPVVVRALDDGRFELVDGERRVRACALVAARAGAEDCRIPALIFKVDAHVALLMRLATFDSSEPRPIELARTYQALRQSMAEAGARIYSARDLTLIGHHGKSQIADYVRIGDAISDDVLIAADLVATDGRPSPEALVDLTKRQLLNVAKGDTVEARAAALKIHHDRLCGHGQASRRRSTGATAPPEGQGEAVAHNEGRAFSLIARSRTMPPIEARALIENEVAPAMIALVEQAHGGRDAEGYYSELTNGHSCLVLPRDVEGLTLEQLDRLDQTLAMLAARTRRAREERLQVGALFAPLGERRTS